MSGLMMHAAEHGLALVFGSTSRWFKCQRLSAGDIGEALWYNVMQYRTDEMYTGVLFQALTF